MIKLTEMASFFSQLSLEQDNEKSSENSSFTALENKATGETHPNKGLQEEMCIAQGDTQKEISRKTSQERLSNEAPCNMQQTLSVRKGIYISMRLIEDRIKEEERSPDQILEILWGQIIEQLKIEDDPYPDQAWLSLHQKIRNWFLDEKNSCHIAKIKMIDLSGLGLSFLPQEIGFLIHLETLHIQKNKLSELPSSIKKLTNLMEINIADNQLGEFPLALRSLPKLISIVK